VYRAVLLALFLLASAACRADAIDAIVHAEMKRQHIPGLSLAIVKNGKVVKLRGYGLANVEHRVPATADTMFQSASVGKQFTAALAMLLVEDGKLSLDAPIATLLPQAPLAWSAITLRNLLNHTAGLPQEDPAIDLQKNYSDDELLQSMFRLPLAAAPGQKWVYSDLGYQVLGIVCTRAGGKFYGDQLRERVFAPLGMDARIISERDLVPHRAAGYDREGGVFLNQTWVSPSLNRTGDGSLLVSARDLAKWSIALETDRPLGAAVKQAMWSPAVLADGSRFDHGFGWELKAEAGHRSVRHSGAWQGFTTYLAHYLDDRLAIAVLVNRSHAQPHVIVERLTGHYLPALKSGAEKR
jgi:CubicO group peptidase (beta-lactamase class C family)